MNQKAIAGNLTGIQDLGSTIHYSGFRALGRPRRHRSAVGAMICTAAPILPHSLYASTEMANKMAAKKKRMANEVGWRDGDVHRLEANSDRRKPFLIGVAGGTASGKSTVCKKILQLLDQQNVNRLDCHVDIISEESFYRELNEKERALAAKGLFDFDHPSAHDDRLMAATLQSIQAGLPVKIPKHDFVQNARDTENEQIVNPADVILVEGILVFYFKDIRDMFDMKLFVDTDDDTRLSRRVMRDINEYKRPLDQILNQYTKFVKPAFEEFCLPTKKYADVIIPRGADNTVAIDLIVQHIQDLFNSKCNGLNLNPSQAASLGSHNSFESLVSRPH